MCSDRRAQGFTLIEAMIVVVLVGVISAIAVVGLQHWIRYSHLGEAQTIVANIRMAEESYYSENGAYLCVSDGLGPGHTYPSQHPGAFKTAWGGPCGWCRNTTTNQWIGLGVNPTAPVMFGYAVIAAPETPPASELVNGKTLDLSNLAANGQPWYLVEATANYNGDGVTLTQVYGMSGDNEIYVNNE